ncbi:uncharacterized protein [Battus philenor]
MRVSPKSARWNLENLELTPIKHIPIKTRPEVKALIAQELPDDEDDDEYHPTQEDVQSDDEHTIESSSDIESLPRTPATPKTPGFTSPKVVSDGPFKVPKDLATPTRRKLDLDEKATIALRTRSKLSLSETSIEHIESSFVPPDDVPTVDVDDPVWNEFLEECLNPASTSHVKNEDDDEADPEYNVAADADAIDEDEEALENSIVKISKKELNDLVTELFSILPEASTEDQLAENLANDVLNANKCSEKPLWEGKQEPISDEESSNINETIMVRRSSVTYFSVGKSEPNDAININITMNDTMNINTENENQNIMNLNKVDRNTKDSDDLNAERIDSAAVGKEIIDGKTPVMILNGKSESNVTVYIEEKIESPRPESPQPQPPQVLQVVLPEEEIVLVQLPSCPVFLAEQILILQQQLRQHIQLATTNFLQLYVHPIHWSFGPKYKEYLETLNNLASSTPNSVVNVCNLKPAIELITTWEKSVSEPTPENTEMVKFIQTQVDRSRTRSAQNSLYVGEFHDTLKDVVANSPVFLYPHLLPAMPYRSEVLRRYKFLRPEDELIALGLDEFWSYVEMNPKLYPCRCPVSGRTGLQAAIKLLCRHMMPWLAPRSLLSHVHYARRNDKDNPIYKFFESRKVEPVKHTLLPYNAKITLYEQPEYEMPRIWIRHLAKTSKRFKDFLYRRTNVTGMTPRGIDIALGAQVTPGEKKPLPIDFTKVITKNRVYLHPKVPPQPTTDKHDVYIESVVPQDTNQSDNITKTVASVSQPICSTLECNSQDNTTQSIETNYEQCQINENEPINEQHTESNTTDPLPEISTTSDHCTCCILLKKICKQRQTLITEYFKKSNNSRNSCPCKSIKRPRITNKLRLLLKYFKNRSMYVHKDMKLKLSQCDENRKHPDVPIDEVTELQDIQNDPSDLAFVTLFEMKLLIRFGLVRNPLTKRNMYILMSNFDHETDDPATLANALEKLFDVELVDLFKEFLRFLTPDQADRINKFKDYFTQNCASDLVTRITAEVTDLSKRHMLLSRLTRSFVDVKSTACGTCSDLLRSMDQHPDLAKYTFSLFPHRKVERQKSQPNINDKKSEQSNTKAIPTDQPLNSQCDESDHEDDTLTICEDSQLAMDCDVDLSSNVNESQNSNSILHSIQFTPASNYTQNLEDTKSIQQGSGTESHDQQEHSLDKAEKHDLNKVKIEMESDCESMKSEGCEWQRSEDKLILEILKQTFTREERKNKSLLDILEEKFFLEGITEKLSHKSVEDITDRVMYLLELLVLSENK